MANPVVRLQQARAPPPRERAEFRKIVVPADGPKASEVPRGLDRRLDPGPHLCLPVHARAGR